MMETMPGRMNKPAGHDAAGRAVHQPADVGGELLRLRARQEHAVVEGMQKPALGDPALLLDQDAVHDRDLTGRAAETERGDPQPDPKGLRKRNAVLGFDPCGLRCRGGVQGWPPYAAAAGGQLWVSVWRLASHA